jgi:Flp pilus assembly protein TadD
MLDSVLMRPTIFAISLIGTLLALGCYIAVVQSQHPAHVANSHITTPENNKKELALRAVKSPPPATLPIGTAGSYLSARHASSIGDSQSASRYIDNILSKSPKNDMLITLSIRHHILAGKVKEAIALMQQTNTATSRLHAAPLLQFIEALHQSGKGEMEEAQSAGKLLQADGIQSLLIPFVQSWMNYARTGAASPVTIADSLKQGMYNAIQHYHEALQYQLSGNVSTAKASYETALSTLNIAPNSLVISSVSFFNQHGDMARAESILKAMQETRGRDVFWSMQTPKQYAKEITITSFAPVASVKDGIAELCTNMGELLLKENMAEEAQFFLQLSLYLRPDNAFTTLTLGEALENSKQFSAAVESYLSITEPPFLKDIAQLFLARTYHANGQTEKARALLTSLNNPAAAYNISVMLGDIERIEKHYSSAAAHYTHAMKAMGALKPHDWPLLFQRGIMYDSAGDWKKAEADFYAALKLRPDEPQILNYLGYSWLIRGLKLEEAESMLKRAVEAAPEEAQIIDSYGWALYLRGKYQEAFIQLDKAISLMPADPTLNDHYGDILWKLGRHREAKYHWERALLFNPSEEEAIKTLKQKIQSGLPLPPMKKK